MSNDATPDKVRLTDVLGHTPRCPECNDTGERDSGGSHPWGEPIYLACECKDAEIGQRWRSDSSLAAWFPITARRMRELQEENERLCAAVTLLRECERTLEMWADVAPAVSLRSDIRKLLAQVA